MAERLPLGHPAALVATWFGAGLLPGAPGTWGSLAAVLCALVIAWVGGPWVLAAATGITFLVGIWASNRYAAGLGTADPGVVVVDEVAGQWLALLPVSQHLEYYAVAFVAFRLFDIVKPWPVSWADRAIKGGFGIMADDIFAGLYAGAATVAIACLFGSWP